MIVVSDTSPVNYLVLIAHMGVLRQTSFHVSERLMAAALSVGEGAHRPGR